MNKKQQGFTLIELLVVIAIIGILASVVLASLNTARAKGADAKIKSELANARTQAALYFDSYNTYANSGTIPGRTGDVCTMPDGLSDIYGSLITTTDNHVVCNVASGGLRYAIAAQLKTGGYWCVDSDGAAGLGAGDFDTDMHYASQCTLASSN